MDILPEVKQVGIEKMRASKAGKPGPWRGKKRGPHTPEWNEKIRLAHKGKPNSPEHNANIAAARRGVKRSAETVAKMRATKLANPRRLTDAEKSALSERWTGKGNPYFGKSSEHGPRTHWSDYNGTALRSKYEVRLAKAFDARGIKWEYEPRRFDLGSCTYLPDFFLPETGAYWEAKGWFDPKSIKKVDLFRSQYPEIPLVVADDAVIKMMEVRP